MERIDPSTRLGVATARHFRLWMNTCLGRMRCNARAFGERLAHQFVPNDPVIRRRGSRRLAATGLAHFLEKVAEDLLAAILVDAQVLDVRTENADRVFPNLGKANASADLEHDADPPLVNLLRRVRADADRRGRVRWRAVVPPEHSLEARAAEHDQLPESRNCLSEAKQKIHVPTEFEPELLRV